MDIKVGTRLKIITNDYIRYGLIKDSIVTVTDLTDTRIMISGSKDTWYYPDKYLFELVSSYKVKRRY